MVDGVPRSTCSQSCAFGDPWSPQIGLTPTYEPWVTGTPLVVEPSTAFAGLVTREGGESVLNDAVAVLPSARSLAELVRSTPAFWKPSTIRALPVRLTCSAVRIGRTADSLTLVPLPSSTLTFPELVCHRRCASSLATDTRHPSSYSVSPIGATV